MLFRHTFTGTGVLRGGMAGVGEAVVLAAAGLGVAALLTPWLVHRLGRPRTVRIALLVAAGTQVALAAWLTLPAVLGAAFLLGGAGQVVKLCADAGVQGEVGDEARGRVFALYDAVFNICYVAGDSGRRAAGPADGGRPVARRGDGGGVPARAARPRPRAAPRLLTRPSVRRGCPESHVQGATRPERGFHDMLATGDPDHPGPPLRRTSAPPTLSPPPTAAAPPPPPPDPAARVPSAGRAGAGTPCRPPVPAECRAAA